MIREEIILRYVRGKDILDIGSTGQTEAYNLFALTRNEAAQIVGIDTTPSINPAIVCGNMETHSFGKQFDVILAGDVLDVKGGVNLDHFGGAKVDQLVKG